MSEPTSASQVEFAERMARIETKLDMHLVRTDEHAKRLSWLETKVNYFIGIMAALNVMLFMMKDKIMRVLGG